MLSGLYPKLWQGAQRGQANLIPVTKCDMRVNSVKGKDIEKLHLILREYSVVVENYLIKYVNAFTEDNKCLCMACQIFSREFSLSCLLYCSITSPKNANCVRSSPDLATQPEEF